MCIRDRHTTHGGLPYNFFKAAKQYELIDNAISLDYQKLRYWKSLWNFIQFLKYGKPKGFQWSKMYTNKLIKQIKYLEDQELNILSIYPLLPSYPWPEKWVVDFYIDATILQILDEYKVSNLISNSYKIEIINREKLNYWDRNAPYPDSPNKKINWSEAKEIVLRSYANFDESFKDIALLFFNNSWIDAELKSGKSPGAFAASTIPSIHPYILTNFHGKTRDVMTLAHELGHGCHQYLSAKQGLLLSSTPLTLAETASVFGEMMTFRTLLDLSLIHI